MIYLVEKYYDRQTAIFCSKVFQIEMDRQSQSAFTIFTGQKLHGDEMVKKHRHILKVNWMKKYLLNICLPGLLSAGETLTGDLSKQPGILLLNIHNE